MFRILWFITLPYLEMKQNLIIDHIHGSQKIAGLDLITSLYGCASELAVECEIISVLHQNAFVISRHHDDLLDHTIKDCTNLRTFRKSYVDTVVWRELKILVLRVIFLAELINHGAVCRPRKISLVS